MGIDQGQYFTRKKRHVVQSTKNANSPPFFSPLKGNNILEKRKGEKGTLILTRATANVGQQENGVFWKAKNFKLKMAWAWVTKRPATFTTCLFQLKRQWTSERQIASHFAATIFPWKILFHNFFTNRLFTFLSEATY